MSKQRPDPDKVTNELAGASAFFRPAPTSTDKPPTASSPIPSKSPEITTEPRKRVSTYNSDKSMAPGFDLNHQPTAKYTLMFTDDELEALDDAKTQLRRTHGLKVAKNDLVRCGLYHILDALQDPDQAPNILDLLKSKKPI